eukprot:m.342816 g.342816  ORF g.342816 m.342816 type:complete len:457 (+) comp21866_c0_seq1:213-1583(+)
MLHKEGYELDPRRFYVLILFIFLMAQQCLFWFTFSSDPEEVHMFFPRISSGVVDQLLNWGPIMCVPMVPFVSFILQRPDGLRLCMRLAAALCFVACGLRLIPCFFPLHIKKQFWSTLPIHLAQILNGIAGAVLITAPSRLSAMWFPPGQRATVTGLANSSFFGAAVGFYMGPGIIKGNPDNVTNLLIACFAISAVPFIAVFCYCPAQPRKQISNSEADSGIPPSASEFIKGTGQLILNEQAIPLIMIVTFFGIGVYDGWIGILPQLLTQNTTHGPGWTQDLSGICGMSHTFSCIAGMYSIGPIADIFFKRRLKTLLIFLFIMAAGLFGWMITMFPSTSEFVPIPYIQQPKAVVFVVICFAGYFRSATFPILFELAAEVSFPHSEGTSGGIVIFCEHLALLTALFVIPHIQLGIVSLACFGSLAICPFVMSTVKSTYKRMDAEGYMPILSKDDPTIS